MTPPPHTWDCSPSHRWGSSLRPHWAGCERKFGGGWLRNGGCVVHILLKTCCWSNITECKTALDNEFQTASKSEKLHSKLGSHCQLRRRTSCTPPKPKPKWALTDRPPGWLVKPCRRRSRRKSACSNERSRAAAKRALQSTSSPLKNMHFWAGEKYELLVPAKNMHFWPVEKYALLVR